MVWIVRSNSGKQVSSVILCFVLLLKCMFWWFFPSRSYSGVFQGIANINYFAILFLFFLFFFLWQQTLDILSPVTAMLGPLNPPENPNVECDFFCCVLSLAKGHSGHQAQTRHFILVFCTISIMSALISLFLLLAWFFHLIIGIMGFCVPLTTMVFTKWLSPSSRLEMAVFPPVRAKSSSNCPTGATTSQLLGPSATTWSLAVVVHTSSLLCYCQAISCIEQKWETISVNAVQ